MPIRTGLPYTHLASPMPEVYRKERYVPRGVSNRRAALEWVQEHGSDRGVLFFLDDDNAIDVRLFEEMRPTETVSMWPVGLIGDYTVSSPIVKDVSILESLFSYNVFSLSIYRVKTITSYHAARPHKGL